MRHGSSPSETRPQARGKAGSHGATRGRRFALLALALAAIAGCSRTFYRQQADDDAYQLIAQKAAGPRWALTDFSVAVDPRSRMYDPFDPDAEPMPPDDPAAHALMHCVDCKKGWPCWHANGDTPLVENPDYVAFLPWSEEGTVVLDADDAVRVALLNSRDYQSQLEELYLSALDVSFERFRFDHQFFGGLFTDYTVEGADLNAFGSSSELAVGTTPGNRFRIEKLYATGAELVVGLANSIVWQFSGPNSQSTTTILDFALVQPLLRGAGRARVLERLTIAERALLSNVRAMERFRREFYVEIVTGRNASGGPSRRGGVFGGAGLEGFSGVGGGGFGQVGGGFGGGGGAGAAQASGFLGLLQDQQNIRNQESNVVALRSSLNQLQALFDAGRLDSKLQVEQARIALYNAQSRLLNSKAGYESSLDDYKITLGLPPALPVVIRDPLLEPFNLIDSEIVALQRRVTALQEEIGELLLALLPEPGQAADVSWSPALRARLERLQLLLSEVEKLRQQAADKHVAGARRDVQELKQAIPRRKRQLAQLGEKLQDAASDAAAQETAERLDPAILTTKTLEERPARLEATLPLIVRQLDTLKTTFAKFQADLAAIVKEGPNLAADDLKDRLRQQVLVPIPTEVSDFAVTLVELSLVQARARTDVVSLAPVELDSKEAVEIARVNRLDWMNARARLVDVWRLIEFNANDLLAGLDIVVSGDIATEGNNPLDFRGKRGRLNLGLEFDAPLTRLAERNTYRQALIEYQQARRDFYAFEDQIARGLRSTLRQIDVNQLNFELRRAGVHVAISQVELARLKLQEPLKPGAVQQSNNTAARDLVSALNDLLDAQNDFLSVWVNYEVQRRSLDLDLGTMQLRADGVWADPGAITAESAWRAWDHLGAAGAVLEGPPCADCPIGGDGGLPPRVLVEPLPPGESAPVEQLPPAPEGRPGAGAGRDPARLPPGGENPAPPAGENSAPPTAEPAPLPAPPPIRPAAIRAPAPVSPGEGVIPAAAPRKG